MLKTFTKHGINRHWKQTCEADDIWEGSQCWSFESTNQNTRNKIDGADSKSRQVILITILGKLFSAE